MPTVGSLFSGVGGLDLGLERAGWQVRWQVEIDDYRRQILARHWPDVQRHGDITAVDPAALAPVDLISGGFPCQDVSVAGSRAGLAGERSGLFFQCIRIAAALRPRWLLIENVPGLLSSNDGRDFAVVLGEMGRLGYWWTYRVVDSQYFGLAQRRRRVFIVGHLGAPCPPEILLEPESGRRDTPPSREATAESTTASLSGLGSGGADDNDAQANRLVSYALTATTSTSAQSRNLIFGSPPDPNGMRGATGFPAALDAATPDSRRYAALGDAVSVPVAHWIGKRILRAHMEAM